jgi:NodT family efflux transporter outer membrane factor (OMF) lipoprotein
MLIAGNSQAKGKISSKRIFPHMTPPAVKYRAMQKLYKSIGLALNAALVITITSSCTVLGPEYEKPGVTWLDDWQATLVPTAEGKLDEQEQALRTWWQLFNDPVLNQLIDTANNNNLTLRIAGLRILESRAVLGIAGSALYPQSQQATSAISYVNTDQHGNAVPDLSGSQTKYQLGFNLTWELDFWGRFRRAIESADAAFLASIANQQDLQVLINAQVTDLYFAYRVIQARIRIANENAALQKRSLEITELRFKNGEDSELDLQQAKTQYLATKASIPPLETNLIKIQNALAVLLGQPPGQIDGLANKDYQLPVIDLTKTRTIPARLLIRRPDVRSAAWQIAAQSAQIGIAEADLYPSIALLGSLGWSGSNQGGIADISSFTIGPALRWNIFDYGLIRNNVRVQDARLQQLIENYQQTVLVAAGEVDDAATAVVKTAETDVLLRETVISAKRSLKLANDRYREGYADFQRVLDAQRVLFTQTERFTVNHGSHINAIVALFKSLGGGWSQSDIDTLIPETTRKTMQERTNWGELITTPIYQPASDVNQAHEETSHEQ